MADANVSMFDLIRQALKLQVRTCLQCFKPTNLFEERLYALLIDVPTEGNAAHVIAATEESLDRAVQDHLQRHPEWDAEVFRAALRWDAPGEHAHWYWIQWGSDADTGHHAIPDARNANAGANYLIQLAGERGLIEMFDGKVCDLAVAALAELEREGLFAAAFPRDQVFVGITDVREDLENTLDMAASFNPAGVIQRVKAELALRAGDN